MTIEQEQPSEQPSEDSRTDPFDSAFASAIKEHSGSELEDLPDDGEEELTADASEAGEESDDTEEAGGDSAEQEATGEQESESDDLQTEEGSPQEELLSDQERKEIMADPRLAKFYKQTQAAFTRKTQEVAQQRKAYEQELQGISAFNGMIEAFNRDPKGTVTQIASQLGLKVSDGQGQQPETGAAKAPQDADAATMKAALAEEVGEELANQLFSVVERLADARVKPLAQQLEQANRERENNAIQSQLNEAFDEFAAAHPDWKQYEPQMMELAKTMRPANGSADVNYLSNLYRLARPSNAAATAKKVVEKQKKALAAADSPKSGVSSKRVQKTGRKPESFDEAYAMAERGEIYSP